MLILSQQENYQKPLKTFRRLPKKSDAIKQTKSFSILLMGVDTGSSERTSQWEGNSDSMILVTVNPETKKNNHDQLRTRHSHHLVWSKEQ